jgi:hypothetical protein
MNEKPRYRCEVAQLPSGRWKYWILHAAGLLLNYWQPLDCKQSAFASLEETPCRRACFRFGPPDSRFAAVPPLPHRFFMPRSPALS